MALERSLIATHPGPISAKAGIGLRMPHQWELLERRPGVGFLEVHSENYFFEGGPHIDALTRLRERYPLSIHGVGLSLGSADLLDHGHLEKLRRLITRFEPTLVSEHLSWGSIDGLYANDLLPLPYTTEALRHMVRRVDQAQNELRRRVLIENISAYVRFEHSELDEGQFLSELAHATGCGILLDVNNLYVNQCNHGTDARRVISSLDPDTVHEVHLAGHTLQDFDDFQCVIDTHSAPVCEPVWGLFEYALNVVGQKPTLIEWDSDLPTLDVLIDEAGKADRHLEQARDLAA